MIEIESAELSKQEFEDLVYGYKLHTALNKWPGIFKILDLEKLLLVFRSTLLNQNELYLFEKGLRVAILALEASIFHKYTTSNKRLIFISCCFAYLDKKFFLDINDKLVELESRRRKYHYDDDDLELIKKYGQFIKLGTFKVLNSHERKLISDACKLSNLIYVDQTVSDSVDFIITNSYNNSEMGDLKRKLFYSLGTQQYKTNWATCVCFYNPISDLLKQIKIGIEKGIEHYD
jgi:hypothetical protein